jgi:hydroxyethylthiazole kinase-like uncharacterized protein yjeF
VAFVNQLRAFDYPFLEAKGVYFARMPAPVISVAQMREWEAASWAAGREESAVIDRVGQLVAGRAARMTRPGEQVLILVGRGHNGDDARRAAAHLTNRRVDLVEVKDPPATEGVAAALAKRPALIIDGLFGIGLNRPLDEYWRGLITRINAANAPVLAIDVPSGLNAETGQPEGAAIRATVTLTLGAAKHGLLLPSAWPYVGRLEVAPDIGLVDCPTAGEMRWVLAEDFRGFPPPRPNAGHKGDFGHLAIVAGSAGYHGAGVLTARGAQRAQPGLITLYTQEAVYGVVAAQLQAVMVSVWRANLKLPGEHRTVLIGPGLAAENLPQELKAMAQSIWRRSPAPVVVDASALAWLPRDALPAGPVRVVTPHPGEAGRLLGCPAAEVQADRPRALREISRHLGDCWVVLKGQQTLIGRSTGPILVNSSGNPHLAQGGSGDVLAGFLAGLLAQPPLQADAGRTISYAVWQHGAAADRLTEMRNNWIIEELVEEIGNVTESLHPEHKLV